jgi:hypothetical protein
MLKAQYLQYAWWVISQTSVLLVHILCLQELLLAVNYKNIENLRVTSFPLIHQPTDHIVIEPGNSALPVLKFWLDPILNYLSPFHMLTNCVFPWGIDMTFLYEFVSYMPVICTTHLPSFNYYNSISMNWEGKHYIIFPISQIFHLFFFFFFFFFK